MCRLSPNSDLITVGPLPSLVYDTHGNTTRLADQQMTYDSTDRHMSTTLADGTTIVYLRDATGRVVARATDTPTEAPVTIRYTSGGAMSAVLDTAGAVIQRSIPLPGGVQVTITGTTQLWSYPNLHGDVILTADATGNRSTMATARRVPPAVGRPQSGARVTRRVWVGASEHPQSCSTPQQPRFQKVIDFPGFLLEHIFECVMIDSCPSPSLSPAPHSRSSRSHWWMPRLLPH